MIYRMNPQIWFALTPLAPNTRRTAVNDLRIVGIKRYKARARGGSWGMINAVYIPLPAKCPTTDSGLRAQKRLNLATSLARLER